MDPYERPESHMGFVVDGHPVDEYGRPIDPYQPHPGSEYMNGGPPENDYGGYRPGPGAYGY